jgi:hypothetical protein
MAEIKWDIELCDWCLKIANCRFIPDEDGFYCQECRK